MREPELLGRAEALLEARKLDEAIRIFDAAECGGATADRCAAGRWRARMLLGDFAAAWKESDAIRQRGAPDPHRFWNGEAIAGRRVMVRCLHGFGDAVQFLRYMPRLRACAAHVILGAPPRMKELAQCFDGVDEVIAWGEPEPAWDVQIEVTELPYFFRTELRSLPLATNYIRLPEAMARHAALALRNTKRPRIGVVWSAGEWDRSRSIPFAKLLPILSREEFAFWNLQGGAVRQAWTGGRANRRDAPEFCDDAGLVPLAAFLAQLDLVITVDTLAAHLAGALSKPAWVLLQRSADWRWMTDRDDSPWYPSLRLFRQKRHRDWSSVIAEVDTALAAWQGTQCCREAAA